VTPPPQKLPGELNNVTWKIWVQMTFALVTREEDLEEDGNDLMARTMFSLAEALGRLS
jgi:hypothetical protein